MIVKPYLIALLFVLFSYSLALHPLEYRFVSCSSGDGLLKIWELGHSMHDRQQHFEIEEANILDSPDSDPKRTSSSDDNILEDNTPVTGAFIPSRSLSTYTVQPAPNSSEDKSSCRVSCILYCIFSLSPLLVFIFFSDFSI